MSIFIYNFFHNKTNDRTENGSVVIPQNKDDWPVAWKTIFYKKYTLFKKIFLPKSDGILFNSFLVNRKSSDFTNFKSVLNFNDLAYILKCGYGLQNQGIDISRVGNRTVPSAGKLYPLEIYFFLFQPTDMLEPGIYHYGVTENVLEPIIKRAFSSEEIKTFVSDENLSEARGFFCITSIFRRTIGKYGSRGYRYILIESGHVAQNMILAGIEKQIPITPIGGVNERSVERTLGLSSAERVIYTLFF